MDKIFETANEIGCLKRYLDTISKQQHLKEWQGSDTWRAAMLKREKETA